MKDKRTLAEKIAAEAATERAILNRLTIECPSCKCQVNLADIRQFGTKINGGGACTSTSR